jgi:hypothetical protein
MPGGKAERDPVTLRPGNPPDVTKAWVQNLKSVERRMVRGSPKVKPSEM